MRAVLNSKDRGRTRLDWLDSFHSFSFGDYYDPRHMGFGPLRVINEDFVAPGAGFPTHGHRDMEIITYVLSGSLEHKDSLGNGSIIAPGEVQMMRAGKGILHSEFNPSSDSPVHLLQIWIVPDEKGLKPLYQQKRFEFPAGEWTLIVSQSGEGGSLSIRQAARIHAAQLQDGQALSFPLLKRRAYWLQMATGALLAADKRLEQGDALMIEDEDGALDLRATADTEVLLFDFGT